ncbi:Metal tolerance protein like [Quillaja saponaria]|uniref:Metal tolerance protein like n=1 Tax=Quillaja saponaria TaxID=32244 RepID=A0AAD7QFY3_QUISA|nr:Metal tolerance protein like [Quillaja saponaria]
MEHEKEPVSGAGFKQEIEMPIASESIDVLPTPPQLSCSSVCAFSKQENTILATEEQSRSAKKLGGLIVFYILVMVVELVGGLKANSLAVITDAAHLLSDVAGFSVSLFAVWASGWEATSQQSFGYGRLEVLGALVSVQLIWLISGFLIYEAVGRILHKKAQVNGKLMFAIAAFGFIINLIMIIWLGHNHTHHACGHSDHAHAHDHEHEHEHEHEDASTLIDEENVNLVSSSPRNANVLNINLQGAYLHVMTDLIQSVGVMIGAAIIWARTGLVNC